MDSKDECVRTISDRVERADWDGHLKELQDQLTSLEQRCRGIELELCHKAKEEQLLAVEEEVRGYVCRLGKLEQLEAPELARHETISNIRELLEQLKEVAPKVIEHEALLRQLIQAQVKGGSAARSESRSKDCSGKDVALDVTSYVCAAAHFIRCEGPTVRTLWRRNEEKAVLFWKAKPSSELLEDTAAADAEAALHQALSDGLSTESLAEGLALALARFKLSSIQIEPIIQSSLDQLGESLERAFPIRPVNSFWCSERTAMKLSRRSSLLFIVSVFLVDLIIALSDFHLGNVSQTDQAASAYETVTSDTLTCYIVRLVVFPALTLCALLVYRSTEAQSPLRKFQQAQEAEAAAESPPGNGNGNDLRVPLAEGSVPMQTMNGENSVTSSITSSHDMFLMNRDHALLMKKADVRKEAIMIFLFAISTGMSFYNGIKCIVYHYDHRYLVLQGTLQALTMVMINAEYFMLKNILNKYTEEQGESIPHIHMHPLFFETGLKCHQCDICSDQMKGPHYVAYRCRTCDFDLCPRCYRQKDKSSARGFGARSLRGDGEQITTWTYFKRIVELAMDFWPTLVAAVVALVTTQSLQIAAPNLQGKIFDSIIGYLQHPEIGRGRFESAIFTYLIVLALQGAFSGLKSLAQELVQRRMAMSVRMKLFASVIRMDIAFFDTMHTGQLTSRMTNDVSQMTSPLNTLLNDLLANVLLLVGGMLMAFKTSWKLSVLALTIVPPITYSYRAYAKWARKVTRSIYCALGEANSTATDAIGNIRTVRGFSTEQFEANKYADSVNTALGHGVKNAYVGATVTAFSMYLNLGTAVLILWYGGQLVCDSKGQIMSIGSLITFQLYWNMMNNAFISLGNVFNDLIRSSSAAERVLSLIDARPDVNPDEGEVVKRNECQGYLQLKGIQFRYRSRPDTLVLKGVDVEMPPGTTTALVGKSGGGKSTLVHLLMRFYEPTAGQIILDGKDTKSLSSKSVRECCGFVAQDTQLFTCSIEENLAYGLGREHSKEEVVAACKAANAHEFILEMEEGYDTRVGEKGIMLSGGQKQRLAVARCFLRRPRMLFLDEATSALDAENEAIVQQALEKLLYELNSTVVLIAHRLSTVINATQICVIHKGLIVEKGTHDELVAQGGVYAQLVSRQLSRDASAVMGEKKAKDAKKTNQTEIDDLIEEMEQAGKLSLDQ